MPTEPNKRLLGDPRVPRITIDYQDWPIPRLAPAQLEIVLPLIDQVAVRLQGAEVGTPIARDVLHDLGTILFHALQRGHEGLTRDEFDQMPIGLMDMLDALPIIKRQAGCYRTVKPGEVNGVSAPLAVAAATTPTGSASPPSS